MWTGRVCSDCLLPPHSKVQSSEIRLKDLQNHALWRGHHTTGRGNSGLNIQIDSIQFEGSQIEEKNLTKLFLLRFSLCKPLSRVFWAIPTYNLLIRSISRLSLACLEHCDSLVKWSAAYSLLLVQWHEEGIISTGLQISSICSNHTFIPKLQLSSLPNSIFCWTPYTSMVVLTENPANKRPLNLFR